MLALAMLSAAPAHAEPSVAERVHAVHAAHARHRDRLREISALFLGARYRLSPLGEGPNGTIDRDPIIAFDRFDCVTYVEEMMALAWQDDIDAATALLQKIRYEQGEIRYGARHHLMIAQWLPRNIQAGFVRDVTREVAGAATKSAVLVLDDRDFTSTAGKKLALDRADRPLGRYSVPIVPVAHMPRVLARVPDGTIVTTVRARRAGVPYRETHVGLVVWKGGAPFIRHAHVGRGRVIEEPLSRFVARAARAKRWPVTGFHLAAINEAPPL
ncbi:MAG TPA: N-acetylmuramoyl-L-alanine amidase-like domain-containing protein [Polyangiaceae bacterium]|nr:N-acetylmuramoyl-L-alanine amidase-like domain-containing protein [Polyangiaceae bacterium]